MITLRFGRARVGLIVTSVALAAVAGGVLVGVRWKGQRDQAEVTKPIGSITTQAVVKFDTDVAATTRRSAATQPATRPISQP